MEYAGACYHVINRGNYRRWVFEDEGTKEAFEACLAEAVVRFGWLVHGWVVMGNHFHVAVQTPEANLCRGMQWLQTTFVTRFNRLRSEHGHLFQGRYRAILVQPGEALGRVCRYIDLNPVRAKIAMVETLETYRHSSFRRLMSPKERPAWLDVRTTLRETGGLVDNPTGRQAYRNALAWLSDEINAGRAPEYQGLSCGWAIGDDEFKQDLRLRFGPAFTDERLLSSLDRTAWREGQWRLQLNARLNALPGEERNDQRPSAAWKATLASEMKLTTDVSNGWLAQALGMSSAAFVSKQAGLARRGLLPQRTSSQAKK